MISILVSQVIMMFLLTSVGFLLFKTGKISQEGSKSIGNILIFVSLPIVIVNGFMVERTPERLMGLLISALLAVLTLAISVGVSRFIFKKDAVAVFSSSFSNPGFFGVPIIVACLSSGAVFYVAAYIAGVNMLQWTYGVALMKGSAGKITPKRIFTAPFMVGILVGLLLFFTQLPLPEIVTKCMSHLAGINTPLAMFTIGIYLAQTDIGKMFLKAKLYLISAVRLLVVPLICLVVLKFVPEAYYELKMAVLIVSACPVGSNVAVYAQLHDADYGYAVETVVISTLFALATMPALVWLAGIIW